MGSNYDKALARLRKAAQRVANKEIPNLYYILTKEERKTPGDARNIIERDLVDVWSKATILKYLPTAVKNELKVRAGKIGRQEQMESAGERRAEIIVDNSGHTSCFAADDERKNGQLHKLIEADDERKNGTLRTTPENSNGLLIEDAVLIEKLSAAEMEIDFLKGKLGGEKIIGLKGNNADEIGQFYWGRITIKLLQQKLPQLFNTGIKNVEVYLRAL